MKFLRKVDRAALIALRTRCHGARTERAVARVSLAGEMGVFWVGVGLLGAALDPQRRRRWLVMSAVAPTTIPVNYLLKVAVNRERPKLRGLPPLGHVPASHSFPSGHASTSFAAAWSAPRTRTTMLGIAALMSLTRPYLGLHYPSDVLGGAAFGSAIGVTVARAAR